MKIKKYEAPTEQEAIEKVKDDLGIDALVLNIKKVQPRGLKAIFVKPYVEVTAAYKEKDIVPDEYNVSNFEDVTIREKVPVFAGMKEESYEKNIYNKEDYTKYLNSSGDSGEELYKEDYKIDLTKEPISIGDRPAIIRKDNSFVYDKKSKLPEAENKEANEVIENLEKKLESTEKMLESVMEELSIAKQEAKNNSVRRYDNQMVQLFYDTLIKQGVYPDIVDKILAEADMIDEKNQVDMGFVVRVVYNKILGILGKAETIDIKDVGKREAKVVAFMGPTGVGKTTTIAKLSSNFILNEDLYVGLITADTYRIAAIEQLKTYAEILNIEISVVYDNLELVDDIILMNKTNDVIFIDTAGRAHNNKAMMGELEELLGYIEDSQRFLVLSLTTKCEDMIEIVNSYGEISDFRIILTKFDETRYFGSILNLCYLTGKKISYLTTGQNVPDDIEVFNPEKIAKALLGIGGE